MGDVPLIIKVRMKNGSTKEKNIEIKKEYAAFAFGFKIKRLQ